MTRKVADVLVVVQREVPVDGGEENGSKIVARLRRGTLLRKGLSVKSTDQELRENN